MTSRGLERTWIRTGGSGANGLRSSIKESLSKFVKSCIFVLAGLILSLADLNIQNCEKWSLISEIMLPLTDTQSGLFTNIIIIIN